MCNDKSYIGRIANQPSIFQALYKIDALFRDLVDRSLRRMVHRRGRYQCKSRRREILTWVGCDPKSSTACSRLSPMLSSPYYIFIFSMTLNQIIIYALAGFLLLFYLN